MFATALPSGQSCMLSPSSAVVETGTSMSLVMMGDFHFVTENGITKDQLRPNLLVTPAIWRASHA